MGVSSEGTLFYGFLLTDEDLPWEESDCDEFVAEAYGWEESKDKYKYQFEFMNDLKLPCEIIRYCTYDDPMYGVAIKESSMTAYLGDAKTITPEQLAVKPEWEAQIKEFCEKTGIKFKKLNWRLTSMYG